jgi:hypothetical protein
MRSSIINALIAGIAYGGWAYFVNSEHSQHAGVMAALVQGISSFVLTLLVSWVAATVYNSQRGKLRAVILGWLASVTLLISVPTIVHFFAGTPNIAKTISLGVSIGAVYLLVYLLNYSRRQDK